MFCRSGRGQAYMFGLAVWSGECLCEGLFVLASDAALLFAVEVE